VVVKRLARRLHGHDRWVAELRWGGRSWLWRGCRLRAANQALRWDAASGRTLQPGADPGNEHVLLHPPRWQRAWRASCGRSPMWCGWSRIVGAACGRQQRCQSHQLRCGSACQLESQPRCQGWGYHVLPHQNPTPGGA